MLKKRRLEGKSDDTQDVKPNAPPVAKNDGFTDADVHEMTRATKDPDAELRIGMPAGVITAAAKVRKVDDAWFAERGSFLRTQRRLFEGSVLVRKPRSGVTA